MSFAEANLLPTELSDIGGKGTDSNLRSFYTTGLQPAPFDLLDTFPLKDFITALAHRTTLPIWGHLDLVCGGGSATRSSGTDRTLIYFYRTLILFLLRKTKKEDRTSMDTDRLPQVSIDTDSVYMGTTRSSGARGIRHNGLAYRSVHMLTKDRVNDV